MGYLKDKHNMILMDKVREGTCPMCATVHKPEQPHNQCSFFYQYKFYDENGRWPTWEDAMAHCSSEIRRFWVEELRKRGVEVRNE